MVLLDFAGNWSLRRSSSRMTQRAGASRSRRGRRVCRRRAACLPRPSPPGDHRHRGRRPADGEQDGRSAVVFNGEIYNHAGYGASSCARPDVPKRSFGHRGAHSRLRAMGRGGASERLEGMFAFAIYDASRAEASPGARPLWREAAFLHPSWPRSCLCLRNSEPQAHLIARDLPLNPLSLQKLFAYSFLPGESTPYSGMKKVLPGSYLLFDTATGCRPYRAVLEVQDRRRPARWRHR